MTCDLEAQAALGEDLERLLRNPLVAAHMQEHLAMLRAGIVALAAQDAATFTRRKAGLEAVEEFIGGLHAVAELGRQARQAQGYGGPNPQGRSRVL